MLLQADDLFTEAAPAVPALVVPRLAVTSPVRRIDGYCRGAARTGTRRSSDNERYRRLSAGHRSGSRRAGRMRHSEEGAEGLRLTRRFSSSRSALRHAGDDSTDMNRWAPWSGSSGPKPARRAARLSPGKAPRRHRVVDTPPVNPTALEVAASRSTSSRCRIQCSAARPQAPSFSDLAPHRARTRRARCHRHSPAT